MNSAGQVTLSLSNLDASTKLSVIDSATNKVVGSFSSSSQLLSGKNFNLAAGDYWLKVETAKSTNYDLSLLIA